MKVAERGSELTCWFFEKQFTRMYSMHGEIHQIRALKCEVRHRTAANDPIFVGWHSLVTFAATLMDPYRNFVTVPTFWQNFEYHRMLCVPLLFLFFYYFSAFGNHVP